MKATGERRLWRQRYGLPRQCAHWLAMTVVVGGRNGYRTFVSFRGSIATVGIRFLAMQRIAPPLAAEMRIAALLRSSQ